MSIIDPIGQRALRSKNPRPLLPLSAPPEAHLRGPENYDTPRSRDIFNVARRLEAGQQILIPPKPGLSQRLLRLFGLSKKREEPKSDIRVMTIENFQNQRQTRDYQRMFNPIHRQLPEDHVAAFRKAEKERKQAVQNEKLAKRKFNGPVPRRSKLPEAKNLSKTLDTAFLKPFEREIYDAMHNIGRCATFTPFTSTGSEDRRQQIMLVHPTNVAALKQVQQMLAPLTNRDKTSLVGSLEGLLIPYLISTLKVLLYQPNVQVTSTSNSGKGYSPNAPKALRKPSSWELFSGKINASWEQISPQPTVRTKQEKKDARRKKSRGEEVRVYEPRNEEGQEFEYKYKPSIFKSFEQKEFMPELTLDDEEDEENDRLHLRGGGGDDVLPFERSIRAYLGRADRCEDGERMPRTLYWLAGGRVSLSKRAPTAGEMRGRRKAEAENRKKVGFVGTLFGVRRPTVTKAEGADDESAEDKSPAPTE